MGKLRIHITATEIGHGLLGVGIFLMSMFFATVLFLGPVMAGLVGDGPSIGRLELYTSWFFAGAFVVSGVISIVGGFVRSWYRYILIPFVVLFFLILIRFLYATFLSDL